MECCCRNTILFLPFAALLASHSMQPVAWHDKACIISLPDKYAPANWVVKICRNQSLRPEGEALRTCSQLWLKGLVLLMSLAALEMGTMQRRSKEVYQMSRVLQLTMTNRVQSHLPWASLKKVCCHASLLQGTVCALQSP